MINIFVLEYTLLCDLQNHLTKHFNPGMTYCANWTIVYLQIILGTMLGCLFLLHASASQSSPLWTICVDWNFIFSAQNATQRSSSAHVPNYLGYYIVLVLWFTCIMEHRESFTQSSNFWPQITHTGSREISSLQAWCCCMKSMNPEETSNHPLIFWTFVVALIFQWPIPCTFSKVKNGRKSQYS